LSETYFLTGALGCIGSWVTKTLAERGDTPLVFDLASGKERLADICDDDALARVKFVQGDITDADAVREAIAGSGARRVIHLAGLQVPFCRENPAKGARVNVLGTINVLEAVAELGLERVVYASSAAVYGLEDGAAPDESVAAHPATHYGVYKLANEGNARVYWLDRGVNSVGIRPLTVYGVGRDQGMTSDPTRAIKSALVEQPFVIRFSGSTDFNYVGDTAAAFVAAADRAPEGAHVFNLHGESVEIAEMVRVIESMLPEGSRGLITIDGAPIPIPPALDGTALDAALPDLPRTSLHAGVGWTIQRFLTLKERGQLRTHDLD